MNVNFEHSKILAGEGSVLLLLGIIPYVGWVLGIIGIVLFLRGMKEFSDYYQDEEIHRDSLTGVKFYIIALIADAVAIASIAIGIGAATGFTFKGNFILTAGFGAGLAGFLAGIAVSCLFYVIAAHHLRKSFNTLAKKSGETLFYTTGTWLWWGAILTIIVIGVIPIFIAWIFAVIGFFSMKSQQYQQYNPQPNSYTQPPTQPEQAKTIENKATEKKQLLPNNIMEVIL